ncbi:MAG: hypothetical protein AAGK21_11255 [Bacteroidota bacterium]
MNQVVSVGGPLEATIRYVLFPTDDTLSVNVAGLFSLREESTVTCIGGDDTYPVYFYDPTPAASANVELPFGVNAIDAIGVSAGSLRSFRNPFEGGLYTNYESDYGMLASSFGSSTGSLIPQESGYRINRTCASLAAYPGAIKGSRFSIVVDVEEYDDQFVINTSDTDVFASQSRGFTVEAQSDTGEAVQPPADMPVTLWIGGFGPNVGMLAYDGTLADTLVVPYGAASSGQVAFVADASVTQRTFTTVVAVGVAGLRPAVETFWVNPLPPGSGDFVVVADPDTLRAGEEATFAVVAPGLDPATSVTLSVQDLSAGGFVASAPATRTASNDASGATLDVLDANDVRLNASGLDASGASDGTRQASVTLPLSAVGNVRFVAADEPPDSTVTVTVTVSAGGESGDVDVTILPQPTVRLLGVDDLDYPLDYVMVSRFPTDERFPSGGRFVTNSFNKSPQRDLYLAQQTGDSDAGDRFTVRPTVSSAAAFGAGIDCSDVEFEIRVLRAGGYVLTFRQGDDQRRDGPNSEEYYRYGAEWDRDDRAGECRMNHFVRFVSNAEPGQGGSPGAANPNGGTYDDQFGRDRTIRVQLGDVVEVVATAKVNDVPQRTDPLRVPVGNLSGNLADVDTPGLVRVQWSTSPEVLIDQSGAMNPDLQTAPDVVTARLSEDFAQVGIAFQQAGTMATYEFNVQNAFRLIPISPGSGSGTWRTQSRGTVGVTATTIDNSGTVGSPVTATYTYDPNQSLQQIAEGLREALAVASGYDPAGGDTAWLVGQTASFPGEGDEWITVVNRGRNTQFSYQHSPEIALDDLPVDYRNVYQHIANVIRVNAREGEARETVDVVVLPPNSLWNAAPSDPSRRALWGEAANYTFTDVLEPGQLSAANVILVQSITANAPDDLPSVMGHEMGHILQGAEERGPKASPSSCSQWQNHSALSTNFLECSSAPTSAEMYRSDKRFLEAQARQMRAFHTPNDLGASLREPRLIRAFGIAPVPSEQQAGDGIRIRTTLFD